MQAILSSGGEFKEVPIEKVVANMSQPRKIFSEKGLRELADSIKAAGVLQPIIVEQEGDRYKLIIGERRLRACKLLNMTHLPAIIRSGVGSDLLRLALIENIQRKDLNVIEEGRAYAALIEEHQLSHEDCSKIVGKDRTTITNALRILTLPNIVHDDLVSGRLTISHAKVLLSIQDSPTLLLSARDMIIARDLNIKQTELLCARIRKKGSANKEVEEREIDANIEYVANRLRSYFRTKVRVSGNNVKGRIEISYFSPKEFERILGLLAKEI